MASMAMESIRLWLALTPKQFEDLNNGKEIQPDEYSKRFGLRWQGTMKAMEFDQNGNLLYKFAADAHQIVWVQRKYPHNV